MSRKYDLNYNKKSQLFNKYFLYYFTIIIDFKVSDCRNLISNA